jgi:hypothetical protein
MAFNYLYWNSRIKPNTSSDPVAITSLQRRTGYVPSVYTPVSATSPVAFTYFAMPSGPRTMLNYITSFGINNASANNNTGSWPGGYDNLTAAATPITTNDYFSSGTLSVIQGDGSSDAQDWTLFYFKGALGDFDGFSNNAGNAWIAAENTSDAATNGATVTKAYVWGFSLISGWELLWEMTAGAAGTSTGQNHQNAYWWTSGGTTTSGNGKRAAYDSTSLTYFGFSVS